MSTIITHTSPDWDAIASVWLLKRYGGLGDADVVFVNTGVPDPAVLAAATAVVDTGKEYDPARLRFDHHQFPGADSNATSATLQVFFFLTNGGDYNHAFFFLNQIAALIYSGDTGKATDGADWSRIEGIHALLSAQKARGLDDMALLAYGFHTLDLLAEASQARYAAQKALATCTVYRSADNLVIALRDAPQGATFAAHEAGARLVVFADYERNAIGVMRGGEGADVHVGELVGGILDKAPRVFLAQAVAAYTPDVDAMFAELATWYRHQAGFFTGRGTAKAPSDKPILVDLVTVAQAIDWAWKR